MRTLILNMYCMHSVCGDNYSLLWVGLGKRLGKELYNSALVTWGMCGDNCIHLKIHLDNEGKKPVSILTADMLLLAFIITSPKSPAYSYLTESSYVGVHNGESWLVAKEL